MDLRFEFGKNWKNYSKKINEERIAQAAESLKKMLNVTDLKQKTFLDIGSGSGLFSLAAARLGAKVTSFDYDKNAVECTRAMQQKFEPNRTDWKIEQGSALDDAYVRSLGNFDVVYSWGVLHHTGGMWQGLENAGAVVNKGGKLFVAIYNDQGGSSKRWFFIKKTYNRLPGIFKLPMILALGVFFTLEFMVARLINFKNPLPIGDWGKEQKDRGMTAWYDLVDWTGGFPFEVAKPDQIFDFYYQRGFTMEKLKTCGSGHGCVEYVFRRN